MVVLEEFVKYLLEVMQMILHARENGLNLVAQVLNIKVLVLKFKFSSSVCGQLSQTVELSRGE